MIENHRALRRMAARRIHLATIGRPYGIAGLVHITCYAADPDALACHAPLEDEAGHHFHLSWVKPGIARLSTVSLGQEDPIRDRATAARLVNQKLFISRSSLPTTGPDEFYLADLIGLAAFDPVGASLGRVSAVHDYGAGASLEIGSLMIPFTRASVPEVDLAGGRIIVAALPEVEVR
ncbi:MAG: ribosome maturation factor RimM [Acetobacteraceae bacterium]